MYEKKFFLNEQKVGMLLQKRTDIRGVGISNTGADPGLTVGGGSNPVKYTARVSVREILCATRHVIRRKSKQIQSWL